MKPEEIAELPEFQKLVASRRRLTWAMSVIMLATAFGFCLASIYAPARLASPQFGGLYPLGFFVTQLLLLIAVVFSFLYAWYVNNRLSALIDKVRRSANS